MGALLCLPTIAEEREKPLKRKDDPTARANACKEIVTSEGVYAKGLRELVTRFATPLDHKQIISSDENEAIFANVRSLADFHDMFYNDLQANEDDLAAIFNRYTKRFQMYTVYINNYDKCIETVDRLQRTNKKFRSFCDQRRKDGFDLMSHLILPIQRVPRYEMLLREVRRFTLKSSKDYRSLEFAFAKIKGVAIYINEQKREAEVVTKSLEAQERVRGRGESLLDLDRQLILVTKSLEVQERVRGRGESLLDLDRQLIREGQLDIPVSGFFKSRETVNVFLFSDALMWCNEKDVFKGEIRLQGASVGEHVVADSKAATSLSAAFELNADEDDDESPHAIQSQLFMCKDADERSKWLMDVGSAIGKLGRKNGGVGGTLRNTLRRTKCA